ncbi:Regulatory protein RecX [bacterium HR33]|nr:Regulatory protein RecX [bacterium HR33]
MIVTALRPDARSSGHVVVEVDRQRYAVLPVEVVGSLGLRQGLILSDELKGKLDQAVAVEGAYRVALRLLAARPRASGELINKLYQRGHSAEAINAALEKLKEAGLLDDLQFARHFVRVRAPRGHGRARLVTDLLQRGVERTLAERAVDEVIEAEGLDNLEQARRLMEKRLSQLEDLPLNVQRRRILAYLRRRGLSGYQIRQLLEEMLSQRC